MEIGVAFPTHELVTDVAAMRMFAEAVEDLGYRHLLTVDHIVGVDPASHPGYEPVKTPTPLYLRTYPIHEQLVLFGWLAAVTRSLDFYTAIMILPQRQTALVAKQVAEVDVLSGGRMHLGVAVGHTDLEFKALGVDFHTRGRRIEEQIEVLRLLWTREVVDFDGAFHALDGVGLNPLPIQRPIPIWLGGYSAPALDRAARLGDGIFLRRGTGDEKLRLLEELRQRFAAHGRDAAEFKINEMVTLGPDVDAAVATARQHEAQGVTHLSVSTQYQGRSVDEHVECLERFMTAYA